MCLCKGVLVIHSYKLIKSPNTCRNFNYHIHNLQRYFETMANNKSSKPERTLIGGSLEIPRMVSGLWQLAGGHDQNVDVEAAAKAMEPL